MSSALGSAWYNSWFAIGVIMTCASILSIYCKWRLGIKFKSNDYNLMIGILVLGLVLSTTMPSKLDYWVKLYESIKSNGIVL